MHVGVTADTLCAYTVDTVLATAPARALSAAQRTALKKRISTGACAALDGLTAGMTTAKKAAAVALYGRAVDALATDGWLTVADAARLKRLAGQL